MPSLPWPLRQDESKLTDAALAALLAGEESPTDAVAGLQPVADVLASLRAGPSSEELAGEASALTEFRRVTGVSVQTQRSHRRRPSVLTSLLRAKVAAAATVVAVLGGLATAAYANKLPAPMQGFAHDTIGAPAAAGSHPDADHAKTGTPVGPNAAGEAAHGLCTAFADAREHGNATQKAVAFRNLAKAAGGPSNVAGFCAGVAHPGASSESREPHGKPSARPAPHAHPTPHAHPAPHPRPTGKPASRP